MGPVDPELAAAFLPYARWHNLMACIPTWDEILEVEYLRQTGVCNMFSGDVPRVLEDMALVNGLTWYQRCKSANLHVPQLYSKVLPMFEAEHGSRDTWITDEVREAFVERMINTQQRMLRKQLRDLKQIQKARKGSNK